MMDVLNGYRDSHRASSDDEDSDDSDKECTVWKRATVKKPDKEETLAITSEEVKPPPPEQERPSLKRKRNTIWSEVLQDQLMSEDLEDCLLKNKPRNYGSRGKESYDYTLSRNYQKSDKDSDDSHMSDDTFAEDEPQPKKRCTTMPERNLKKFVELSSDELAAARKINKVLNEKKFYLIQRIVKYVGIEKATKLLSMTEQIEETGGMMIKNNARRRTPGGVYIQLLKSDKDIPQDIQDKIFEGEMSAIEIKKYYSEQKKKRKRFNRFKKRELKETSQSNKMLESGMETVERDEMVPMDADGIACQDSSNSSDNVPSMPVQEKSSAEKDSDLEEGEIED